MKKATIKTSTTDQPAKKTYQDYNNQKPVRNDPHFIETDAGADIPDDDQAPPKKPEITKSIRKR